MFGFPRDEQRTAAIRALKEVARPILEAADDDAVVVSELRCSEPGCPPLETVVALLRAGHEPRQVKVHKPVQEVTEHDLRSALHALHVHDCERG
jgi:hypothetical protein